MVGASLQEPLRDSPFDPVIKDVCDGKTSKILIVKGDAEKRV